MSTKLIAVLPVDVIGTEIMAESVKFLKSL